MFSCHSSTKDTWHPMPAMPARKGNLRYIHCHASASPFEVSPETTAHKSCNCSSCSCSRSCSLYHWLWARFDCRCRLVQYNDHLKLCARKMRNVRERQPFSTRATRCAWCGRVQISLFPGTVARRPKSTYIRHHCTKHHTTRLCEARSGSPQKCHSDYQERGTVCMSLNYRRMRF